MKYNTNPAMRGKILETARRFYYDYGFENTSFDRIAEECGISKGLITYHFHSKAELGTEVFESNRFTQAQFIERRMLARIGETDGVLFPAVFDRVILRQMRDDERVRDFFHSVSPFSVRLSGFVGSMYERFGKDGATNRGKGANPLVAIASRGAAIAIINEYFDNTDLQAQIPYEEFEEYRVGLHYEIRGYAAQEVERICKESSELANRLGIEYAPYFKLR